MTKKQNDAEAVSTDSDAIDIAITAGKAIVADGKPKIEAAMWIYSALVGVDQDTVVSAFIEGASLTPKGALTYWYNCRRKHRKLNPAE